MNDRFKFRLRHKIFYNSQQEWICSPVKSISQEPNGSLCCYVKHKKALGLVPVIVGDNREAILEQCTGFPAYKSYRGTGYDDLLIYEGDKLQLDGWPHRVYVVCWLDGSFRLCALNERGTITTWKKNIMNVCYANLHRAKIIGTIHDEERVG